MATDPIQDQQSSPVDSSIKASAREIGSAPGVFPVPSDTPPRATGAMPGAAPMPINPSQSPIASGKPASPKTLPHQSKPWADPATSLDEQADFARQQLRQILTQMRSKSSEAINPANWARRYPIGGLVAAAIAGIAGIVALKSVRPDPDSVCDASHDGQSCGGSPESADQAAGDENDGDNQPGSGAGQPNNSTSDQNASTPADSHFQRLARKLLRSGYKHGLLMARAVASDFLARSVKGTAPDPSQKSPDADADNYNAS